MNNKQAEERNKNNKIFHITFWVLIVLIFGFSDPWSFYRKLATWSIIGYTGYFIYRYFSRKKEISAPVDKTTSTSTPYNRVIFEDFLALGTTVQEREKSINRLFDEKKRSIDFQWHFKVREQYRDDEGKQRSDSSIFKTIALSRNLASMDVKERELLRITFHLFNEGKMTETDYCYHLLAFVYGNGKASIKRADYNGYKEQTGLKDAPSVVRSAVDALNANVDSAVNRIMQHIAHIEHDNTVSTSLKKAIARIHGGGNWFSEEDIESSVFKNQSDYSLTLGALDESGKPIQYSGEGSLITIAPPGSGKTQCFVFPNLLNWKGAALVLDIKNEIYRDTYKWREKNVGKVYKFSPLDPKNSNNYNPLDFVRDDPEYIWDDALFLTNMMLVPSGGKQDPYWEDNARNVLTAAIAYIVDDNVPGERSMSKVMDIIYGIGWDEMVMALKLNVSVSAMRRAANALEDYDPKQKDTILKSLQGSLGAWQGTRMEKVTQKSDWHPMDLRNGTPTIYICIDASAIDSYLSVIRVFLAQHLRTLTAQLPDRKDVKPILFMLDELPRLKNMPPVDEALNIGRQYGIKLWMFAQSYGQLKEAYPNPEGLVGSCAVRTFMNMPLNDDYTSKLSDQLGYRHDALSNTKEKLVEPVELAGPEYEDKIIVLATGTKPAKLKKKYAYKDAAIKSKMEN